MIDKIQDLVNWFIPLEIRDNINEYSKAKMTVGIGLLLGFIVMLQSFRSLFLHGDIRTGLIIIFFSLLVMGGPLLLRVTHSKNLAANTTLTGLFILAYLVILMRGGISSSITSYLSMVPFCALMMSGLRFGIIWCLICIVATVSAYSMKRMGVELPAHQLSPQGMETYLLVTYSSLIVFATILGSIFETVSDGNFNRFKRAQARTESVIGDMEQAIDGVNRVMQAISANDLSRKVEYQIEGELNQLKVSVNQAIDLLSTTILDVADSSRQINIRADAMAESAKTLAEGTATQAASIREITSTMGDVDQITRKNNENANQSRGITQETLASVQRGNTQMTEMVSTMNLIADSGQNINKIVKVIDEIAFQTNLLALNAAVEAARAGKYGKGFAVVAEEVRSLAGRSAEAARDTTSMIDTTIRQIENGVNTVNVTAGMLSEITENMDRVNGLIEDIAEGSNTQRTSIEEITRELEQVNQIVQQNASISEKTAGASGELKLESVRLQETMQQFVLQQDMVNRRPGDKASGAEPLGYLPES